MDLTIPGKMMVAAHRGDSYNGYENTLEAFRMAIASGADMVETDVHLSRDGVLVLMHDDLVDRTTDGTGPIAEKSFAALRQLNAGSSAVPLQIPTLEELLQLLQGTHVTLNLEIKEYNTPGNEKRCIECIEKCIRTIMDYHFEEQMLFNSFDAFVLQTIHEHYPHQFRLHGFYPYSIMSRVDRNPDEYLYCACLGEPLNPEHYSDLTARGIEPWIGASVVREPDLKTCFELGARLVTTNFPADCLQKLKNIGAR